MAVTLTPENKSTLTITNESKPSSGKWNSDATRTWGDGGTWGQPGTFILKETKNTLAINNETK
jgi:hypothetical protein